MSLGVPGLRSEHSPRKCGCPMQPLQSQEATRGQAKTLEPILAPPPAASSLGSPAQKAVIQRNGAIWLLWKFVLVQNRQYHTQQTVLWLWVQAGAWVEMPL